jgi:hypothetical protein
MDEKIGPETEERIRELCRKISVAHNLDEEIQRELFSHMEDKLLAYLSGEEKITEEDAFVLVREHFGDPEEVKAMLEEVHYTEMKMALFRKVGLIASLTFFLMTAGEYLLRIMSAALFGWVNSLPINQNTSPFSASPIPHVISSLPLPIQWLLTFLAHELPPFCAVALLWLAVSELKEKKVQGKYSWFLTDSPSLFLMFVLSGFLLSYIVILGIEHLPFYQSIPKLGTFFSSNTILEIIYLTLSIMQCLVWLWWFDDRSGRYTPIIIGLIVWITYNIFIYNQLIVLTMYLRYYFSSVGFMKFFHFYYSFNPIYNILMKFIIYGLVAMLLFTIYRVVSRSMNEKKNATQLCSVK